MCEKAAPGSSKKGPKLSSELFPKNGEIFVDFGLQNGSEIEPEMLAKTFKTCVKKTMKK